MPTETQDGALMASITSTARGHYVRYWVQRDTGGPPKQSDLETFATIASAVAYAHKVATALGYQAVYWLPTSAWRPAEIEQVT
jgi:hypothetical protein